MDIKLKKFNDNMMVRVLAFVLCTLLFVSTLGTSVYLLNQITTNECYDEMNDNINAIADIFTDRKFKDGNIFENSQYEIITNLVPLIFMKNENYINSGKTITESRLTDIVDEFFYQGIYYIYNDYIYNDSVVANPDGPAPETYDYGPLTMEEFREANKDSLELILKSEISSDLNKYKNNLSYVNSLSGMTYYVSDGERHITNIPANSELLAEGSKSVKDGFNDNPVSVFYDNGLVTGNVNKRLLKEVQEQIEYCINDSASLLSSPADSEKNYKIYYTFDKSFFADRDDALGPLKETVDKLFPILIFLALTSLFLFIYLLVTTGRKNSDGSRKLYTLDKIFMEIQVIGVFLAGIIGCFITNGMIEQYIIHQAAQYGELVIFTLVLLPIAIIGLWLLLSIIRTIKAGLFWKRCFTIKCCSAIYRGLKSIFTGGSTMRKVVLTALAICLLSATIFLAPVIFILLLILAPKIVGKYEAIKKGVAEVKSGNVNYKIPVDGDGEFDRLARDINEISKASSIAIENELKNQRLKTDLISNVSHDLKTPLTSIITYIDLLKQEGLDCNDAPKYLDILDQKAARLKNLTEDLFEAAKASSGDIPVKFEKVEFISMLKQSLGEFSDRIDGVNLEFKLTSEQEKYYVNADRQLLWRVIENLFGNVVKYAQEGSRVYIEVKSISNKSPMIVMEIKNISKTELNVHVDELMERFKRGDESRTTEGSGLGLAIAKDLVLLQNGWFEIKIDGDLFKAIIMLEAA